MEYKQYVDKFQKADTITKLIYIGGIVIVLILLKVILQILIPLLIIGVIIYCLILFVKAKNIQSKTKGFKQKGKNA